MPKMLAKAEQLRENENLVEAATRRVAVFCVLKLKFK
jgi:hypothetical protein